MEIYVYMVLGFAMGGVAGIGIGCLLLEWFEKRREKHQQESYNHIRTAFSPPEKPNAKKPWEKSAPDRFLGEL